MVSLKFDGSGAEYFKIWIVNIFLTIVTLGLYYPWAKVRNRRYFYGNTILEDRNFEYHATGKQLFLGFIISMAIFIAYVMIQKISPEASLILLAVLFIAIPWLIWRSMMFNMRMTSFSNVRFGFVGNLRNAYMTYFIYPIFLLIFYMILAAGLAFVGSLFGTQGAGLTGLLAFTTVIVFFLYAFAFIKKKTTEYKLDGIRYGQGVFKTNLEIKSLMMIILKTIVVNLLIFGIVSLLIGVFIYVTVGLEALIEIKEAMQKDPQQLDAHITKLLPVLSAIYLGIILASMFVVAYVMTRLRIYIFENTTLDDHVKFASSLQALPFAWVMITNFLATIFTLGLAYPWAKVRMARLVLENTLVDTSSGFDTYITQKQKEQSSLGEQIGDEFDIDTDIGF